jgi:DNA repair protein RAD5
MRKMIMDALGQATTSSLCLFVQRVLTRSMTLATRPDMQLSDGPPEGLFFAGSDDDEEDTVMDTPETPPASSRASSPTSTTALFMPGSDDDEDLAPVENEGTPVQKRKLSFPEDQSDNGIELPVLNAKERASSVQSVGKMSTMPESSPAKPSTSPPPPPKKRRISPPAALPHTFQPTYLGEILVPNAWSNVSGKGYVKPNESIQIKRDEQTELKPVPNKSATTQGKKKGDSKKQMSLTAMLKNKPIKASKKTKTDNIVRLFNSRGFGNVTASCLLLALINRLKNSDVFQQTSLGGYQSFLIWVRQFL